MLALPLAWALEAGLSSEAGIQELWDNLVLVISGAYTDTVCSSLPPPWTKRDSICRRALHRAILLHSHARWARAGVEVEVEVEVEAKAHKLGL